MRRLLLVGLSLVVLSACDPAPTGTGGGATGTGGSPTATAEPTRQTAAETSGAAKPSGPTVADYFSPPKRDPGPTWTKNGKPVSARELNTIAGPGHCGWQDAVFMHLSWPLGTKSQWHDARQFIRDPNGVLADWDIHGTLGLHVDLPTDARDTGYRHRKLELWLVPSDPYTAYLRVGNDVERWPRADPVVGCR